MFGHQDDKKEQEKDDAVATITPDEPAQDAADQTDVSDENAVKDHDTGDAQADASDASEDDAWQHPGEPLESEEDKKDEDKDKDTSPDHISDIIAPSGSTGAPHIDRPIVGGSNPDFTFSAPSDDDNIPHELIDIKQKALHELEPLVDKLDQTPEDRFRTLMMMIQASDDQKLVKEAYEAAHSIQDEKVRGQALLDIVNEINYFTQHPEA